MNKEQSQSWYDAIHDQVESLAADTPYSGEGLFLVWQTIAAQSLHHTSPHHVSARDVCWWFRDLAVRQYGLDARTKVNALGIHNCNDIGQVIQLLVDGELIHASDDDDVVNDVKDIYDFNVEFHPDAIRRHMQARLQWRLSTLLLITTILAIIAAGWANRGIAGAMTTLFTSWMALVGAICLWLGLKDRTIGWNWSLLAGVLIMTISAISFYAAVAR